jgi:uncharacterized protein YcsI (UPF0317 family)
MMNPHIARLESLIARDPGGRNMSALMIRDQLRLAATSLLRARRVGIVTGFFVPEVGAGETDGPPGAVVLGGALLRRGVSVDYLTDEHNAPILQALGVVPIVDCSHYLSDASPTHLVAIERVGRTADGSYRNMRGEDISNCTAPLDQLFLDAPALGVTTIGIGDGGNEIGMGKVFSESPASAAASVGHDSKIASVVATDFCIVAGVSNWGAYGLTAALSVLCGEDLLFDSATIAAQIEKAVLVGGAVDGRTRAKAATVDGLGLDETVRMANELHEQIRLARLATLSGAEIRERCRRGEWTGATAGCALGYVQANLVVVRASAAKDFHRFCELNPKPCPILEVTSPGCFEAKRLAPGSDLRTDLPRYRVLRDGICVERVTSVEALWDEAGESGDPFVAFLLGCSFSFEAAMLEARLPVRHIAEGKNVPMYRTSLSCHPAGVFAGSLVVSMRPMTPAQAEEAELVTARTPLAHGGPVHVGDPSAIGIARIDQPDYGDAVTIGDGEVPVFWACGVTPMEALLGAKLDLAIVHEPGHMFVSNLRDEGLGGG